MNIFSWLELKIHPYYDGDGVDRLNHFWSGIVILLMAIFSTLKQYAGEPIECWTPATFKPAWTQYTKDFCFISNTYFLYKNETFPDHIRERKEKEIGYYQWVPFFLAFQSLGFYAPQLLRSFLNSFIGIRINTLIKQIRELEFMGKINRQKDIEIVGHLIREMLEIRRRKREDATILKDIRSVAVVFIFVFIKVCNILQPALQLYLISLFIGTRNVFWGYNGIRNLFKDIDWELTGVFPRVTYCDFTVREKSVTNPYTTQCVLMINMFNEKIFLIIWAWLLSIIFISTLNLVSWIWTIAKLRSDDSFLQCYITDSLDWDHHENDRDFNEFKKTLGVEGLMFLQILSTNISDLLLTEVITCLWRLHKDVPHNQIQFGDKKLLIQMEEPRIQIPNGLRLRPTRVIDESLL